MKLYIASNFVFLHILSPIKIKIQGGTTYPILVQFILY